jgi:uncharacterized repeat protein (TIGR03803 family)
MQRHRSQSVFSRTVVLGLTLLIAGGTAAAKEKVLYTFTGGTDGQSPGSALTFDSAGNLYGTNQYGQGASANGNVFELTHSGSGWNETVIYGFADESDGYEPTGSLAWDAKGNLFGVTEGGGALNAGTVFELSPSAGGGWTKTTPYTFSGGGDGGHPVSLISDGKGNLYGTTIYGGSGSCSCGTVFKLKESRGSWTETVIHSFLGVPDGSVPVGLTFDQSGNLYGATELGGTYNAGTVFQITRSGNHWKESILHNFTGGADGDIPEASVVVDQLGNLYGTTVSGGAGGCGCGIVFKLERHSNGKWEERVLHNFKNNGHDGSTPTTALIFDSAGNLYGTTYEGGAYGAGTAFELMQNFNGSWIETVIETFIGPSRGSEPNALVLGNDGYLYGSALGGAYNAGVVFQLSP